MMTVFAHFNCHTVTVTKVLCVFFMFVLLKLVHWTTFGNSDLQHYRTRFRNWVPGCNYLGTRTRFQIPSELSKSAWGVGASQLMILVVSLTKAIRIIARRRLWMWSQKYIRDSAVLLNVVNRCKYGPKSVVFCMIAVANRVVVTRIWNLVRNFGTGSRYPVPTTNH